MGIDYKKVKRGNLTFYISPKKIYCKTPLQMFYIINSNPFSNTTIHIDNIALLIQKRRITSLSTLFRHCNNHLQLVHTDRSIDAK